MAVQVDEESSGKRVQQTIGVSFEDALEAAKFGKFHYFLIFISGLFMASVLFETLGINYVLPVAECDLKITSKHQYGIVSGSWFAGVILSSHVWGFLSDTYGRKKILITASLLAFGASVIASLTANLFLMAFFRFLNGLFISGSTSTIFAYLGEFLESKTRSRSMMVSSVIFGVFCPCLPFVAWLIINQKWSFFIPVLQVTYKPWRLFLLACAFPSLVCGVVLIFFPESPKFTFSQGDEENTLKIFRKVHFINTGTTDYPIKNIIHDEEFGEASKKNKNVTRMMLDQIVTLVRNYPRSIGILSLLQFGIQFVCFGTLVFFPDILNQTANYMKSSSGENIGLCKIVESAIEAQKNEMVDNDAICNEELDISTFFYSSLLEVFYTGGFIVISYLVEYVSRLSIFSVVFFSTGICGILVFYVDIPALWTFLYIWSLASGVNENLLATVTYDLFPTTMRSLAMNLSTMFGRLGCIVGAVITGYLMEKNCQLMFTLSGSISILSGFLTFFLPNIMKKK